MLKASKFMVETCCIFSDGRYGELTVNRDLTQFNVDFSSGELVELHSNLAAGGRAMELSELRHQQSRSNSSSL